MTGGKIKTVTDRGYPVIVYRDFLESSKLTLHEKMLFIHLKMYADKDGKSFPSLATLAKVSGMSKRKVQQCLDSMRVKGVLKIEHREDDVKGHKSNLYTIYDVREFWTQETGKESKSGELTAEIALKIAELQALGFEVIKKEPPSTTADQSKVDDDSKRIDKYSNRQHTSKPGERQPQDIAQKKRTGNKFNDFQQRERSISDYDDLERRLLQQQMGE